MAHEPERDWLIVAPWWKWERPPSPIQGRVSRPVLQKYDTSDLVNEFIKNPQRSLKFVAEDLVHHVENLTPVLGLNLRPRRFSDKAYVPDGTNTRKVFRDTHRRFYLVVCQVHCDGPGFPKVARDKVCEAGFVVRRRTTEIPSCSTKEAGDILKALQVGRARLKTIEKAGTNGNGLLARAQSSLLAQQKASVQAMLGAEQQRFQGWVAKFGVTPQLHGWFKSPEGREKIGCWNTVEETPAETGAESTFPLYPLVSDRNVPGHAGHFGTVYFGLLPTSTGETTERGEARFDERTYYEVRCFVKRHKVPHDKGSPCKCPDRLYWSRPTDPYKIAAHFDLVGTSKRPVTIQLPDLNELAAQAKPTLGASFQKPPGYPMVTGTAEGKPVKLPPFPGFQICSFPIPLITIVAMFVFEIFLPVVMLLFQLYWMLAFKFCIPPEISAAVTAEIGLDVPVVPDEVNLAVSVNASISANFDLPPDDLAAGVVIDPAVRAAWTLDDDLKTKFSPIAVANMEVGLAAASKPSGSPTVSGGAEWEAEVSFP